MSNKNKERSKAPTLVSIVSEEHDIKLKWVIHNEEDPQYKTRYRKPEDYYNMIIKCLQLNDTSI